ncbi:MAG: protein kinase, partial [Planctomycetaceae bacterium]|nr:protein kinase [Planctomycetaceae bacterium]
HAHDKGVVHRDIKPSNLMVAKSGLIKLTDMGLARAMDDDIDTSITRDGTTVGTVDYMSPEQAVDSKAADIRSDIYSLGCTWYHMITGQPPYPDGSVTNKLTAHATFPLPDPRLLNKKIPEPVVAVIHRMIAKKPEDRYATPAELINDLESESILRGEEPIDLLAVFAEDEYEEPDSQFDDDGSATPDSPTREVTREPVDGRPSGSPVPSGSRRLSQRDDEVSLRPLAEQEESGSGELPSKDRKVLRRMEFEETDEEDHRAAPRQPLAESPLPSAKPPREILKRRKYGEEDEDSQRDDVFSLDEDDAEENHPRPKSPSRKNSRKVKRGRREGTRSSTAPTEEPSDSDDVTLDELRNRSRRRKQDQGIEASTDESQTPKNKKSPAAPPPRKRKTTRKTGSKRTSGSPDTPPSKTKAKGLKVRFEGKRLAIVLVGVVFFGGIAWYFSRQAMTRSPADDPAQEGPESDQPDVVVQSRNPDQASSPEGSPDFKELEPQRTASLGDILPDWMKSGWTYPARNTLPTIVVERGSEPRGNSTTTLTRAWERLAGSPGRVEFRDREPRSFQRQTLENCSRRILAGLESGQATVLLNSEVLNSSSWLSISKGTLEIQNLQFVVETTDIPNETALFSLQDGNVILRNCSFHCRGDQALSVIRVSGNSEEGNRILVENCVASGPDIAFMNVDGVPVDCMIRNTFLATDGGSLVIQNLDTAKSASHLRVVDSTVLTGRNLMRFSKRGISFPAPVVDFRESVFATPGPSHAAAICLENWPGDGGSVARTFQVHSENVRWAGWPQLASISFERSPQESAVDIIGWQRLFSEEIPSDDLISGVNGWGPETSLSELPLAVVDEALSPLTHAGLGNRAHLGASGLNLDAPAGEWFDRTLAWGQAERILRDDPDLEVGKDPIRLDLSRASEIRKLTQPAECPDGSQVLLSGSGVRSLPFLEFQNRHLKITFEQTKGATLSCRPEAGSSNRPLFLIDGGHIEIENLDCAMPASGSEEFPGTLVRTMNGGRVTLRNCEVNGLDPNGSPLIQLGQAPPQAKASEVTHSFLKSRSASVGHSETSQPLIVSNSVVASEGSCFTGRWSNVAPAPLILRRSTFAFGNALIDIASSESKGAWPVVASESVFLPLSPGVNSPTFFVIPENSSLRSPPISWWEDACGESPLIAGRVKHRQGDSWSIHTTQEWLDAVGPAHVTFRLSSQAGVLLTSGIPPFPRLTASSVQLDPSCLASKWSVDGGSVGAMIDQIGISRQEQKPESPGSSTPNRPSSGRAQF